MGLWTFVGTLEIWGGGQNYEGSHRVAQKVLNFLIWIFLESLSFPIFSCWFLQLTVHRKVPFPLFRCFCEMLSTASIGLSRYCVPWLWTGELEVCSAFFKKALRCLWPTVCGEAGSKRTTSTNSVRPLESLAFQVCFGEREKKQVIVK